MRCVYAGHTDKGLVRKKNEDSWGAFPEQGLFIVADGVGGMPAGDIASRLVIEVLPLLLTQRISAPETLGKPELSSLIKQALVDLSNRIYQESQNRVEYAGMGSTIVTALFTETQIFIAHLGDSRAYLVKQNALQQLTNDHSLVRQLLMIREISQQQAENHPGKNHIVQYVGMSAPPKPDVICIPRVNNERLLLCSDGLTNMLSKQKITELLNQFSSLEQSCNALIKAANQAGGKDNVTIVLVENVDKE